VDPGACSRVIDVCEKTITLDMVKLVRDRLRSDKIEVILTRDSDFFIPLPDRPRIAQKANADLFVSLHADSLPSKPNVKGATVYMVSEKASDREAARLAANENSRDVMAGVALENESKEVQNILISLVQRDTLNSSVVLARSVLDELDGFTEVRKREVLHAGFRVLKSPDVPSILVEMGYLSNPTEASNLNKEAYRKKLADAIAKGIRAYVQNNVHY
ncbi:MAG: N-acetylmuramoyl-L-alanine amidase, partial [Pseudomonas fluorescens]